MENKVKKIGIVGFGGMATMHANLIKNIQEVELAGVYDILEERNEAAKKMGIHAYDSYEALLSDEEIDIVTVATPNDTHKELAIEAIKAKKNVVCEKPVCINSLELKEIIEAAKENEVLFTVHQNRRWDEDYLIVKKIFDENILGKVFNIESRVHGSRGIPGDWRNKKENGGGMVLDWGVHMLDQIMQMIDKKLISLYATLSFVTNEEVDDGFTIILKFEDDITCKVEVGTSNFISLPRWYVQGENGTAIIEDWQLNGEITMVSDWEKRDAVPVVTAAGLTKTMAPRTNDTIKEYPLPRVETDIKDYYRNVVKSIDGKEEIIVKTDEVMTVMKVMEAVFESATDNKVVFFN